MQQHASQSRERGWWHGPVQRSTLREVCLQGALFTGVRKILFVATAVRSRVVAAPVPAARFKLRMGWTDPVYDSNRGTIRCPNNHNHHPAMSWRVRRFGLGPCQRGDKSKRRRKGGSWVDHQQRLSVCSVCAVRSVPAGYLDSRMNSLSYCLLVFATDVPILSVRTVQYRRTEGSSRLNCLLPQPRPAKRLVAVVAGGFPLLQAIGSYSTSACIRSLNRLCGSGMLSSVDDHGEVAQSL